MSDDLVTRLRYLLRFTQFSEPDHATFREAADLIEGQAAEITRLKAVIAAKADLIECQAKCFAGYAEDEGHTAKPVPSVFHSQATHFRDIANDLRAALTTDATQTEGDG